MAPPDLVLLAQHLTKRFAGVTALDDVSFDLRPGEIHALCGENGAGKSTLIKLLSGVHPYGSYRGRFEVAGVEARFRSSRDASAAGIAVIHQELAFVDELSVADNICLGQEPVRFKVWLDRREALHRAAEVLARFGVPLDPRAPMRSLGVGQKQLVEIAKALTRDSRILILDEPNAALAGHEVSVLLQILRDLRTQGIGCIYISHRLEEVMTLADRVTVLRDGAAVCTLGAGKIDATTIVRHMVGRELGAPRAPRRPRSFVRPRVPALSVQNLAVTDEKGAARLDDISFDLDAGEVLGIGGLMGAGRTELLMHLYGMWGRRTAGRVLLAGSALAAHDPGAVLAAGMALVSEDRRRFGLIAAESVGFNLSLSSLRSLARAGVIRGRDEAKENRRWFDSLGVRAAGLDAVVGRLSGGNQQKVVLGRALMMRPQVVLLDEPTRGIDIGAKLEIYALIDRLVADGCAVLLVSSELPELLDLCDRILILREGAVGGMFPRDTATPEMLLQAALGAARPATAGRSD